jgi:hypothetical protein
MSLPVIQMDEGNGTSPTITQNIGSIAYASVDQNSNTGGLSAANPILIGTNSFEKWIRARVATAAPNSLTNFEIGFSATAPEDSGGSSSNIALKYGVNASFPGGGPTASTSSVATIACPGAANVPINTPANTVGATSGWITTQLQAGGGAAGGNCIFPSPFFSLSYIYA